MSDNDAPEYKERTADEMAIMERQFKGGGYGGHAWVAPPAPGHDVRGLWHYFDAHGRSGYAVQGVALHHLLLHGMGIPTSLVPHRQAALDIEQFPADRADMLTKWLTDGLGLPEVVITTTPPDLGMYDMAPALVNYVAGPEATHASFHAQQLVNGPQLTALWCVSPFTARAYLNAGVKPEKVFVVRPPICDGPWRNMFRPIEEILARKPGEKFVFGVLGTWHERKGFHDLIRAYFREFKRGEPVELQIRTSSLERQLTIKKFEKKIVDQIAAIAREMGDTEYPNAHRPKIRLLTGTDLSEQELIDWLGSLDAYVNPSYGEGLGVPQMWALAQGVPMITSNFGAVGEFCEEMLDDVFSQPFPSQLVPVPTSMRGHSAIWSEDAQWGGYQIEDLAAAMRQRFVAPGYSANAAHYVRDYFRYDRCRPLARHALCAVVSVARWDGWDLR